VYDFNLGNRPRFDEAMTRVASVLMPGLPADTRSEEIQVAAFSDEGVAGGEYEGEKFAKNKGKGYTFLSTAVIFYGPMTPGEVVAGGVGTELGLTFGNVSSDEMVGGLASLGTFMLVRPNGK